MKYLWTEWGSLKKNLKNKAIFLFLDYDGTIAPIAATPDKAVLPKEAEETLHRLSKNSLCSVAIISGRALSDIEKMVSIEDIVYVGNHGLEIAGPRIRFESQLSPQFKVLIGEIKKELITKLLPIRGIFVEDKLLTLSVHYRLAEEKDVLKAKKIFDGVIESYLLRKQIEISSGKKVWEVKPLIDWRKGDAVLWLLARQQFILKETPLIPIYIGDDEADEDAFKALGNKGLTIVVDKPNDTYARYYLNDTKEVAKFLSEIADLQISNKESIIV